MESPNTALHRLGPGGTIVWANRAEQLLKITAAVADAVTTAEVFQAVVDQVAEAVRASSTGLWLVEGDGRTVRLARSVGYKESANREFDRIWLDANPSIPAIDAIRRGEPIWIPSQEALLREYPHLRGAVTPGRTYRVACLPLVSQDRTLGALGITIEDGGEATEEERDFLLLVARYAGQAIERLRLLEAERRSRAGADAAANRLTLLNQVSRTFAGAELDIDSCLGKVASELSTALASSINIRLVDADEHRQFTAVHHPSPEADDLVRTVGAPLRVRGRVIGTVTATRGREHGSFTPDDLKLLEELAERAAVAVENARLYRETANGRARAEQLYRFSEAVVAADRVEVVFDAALSALEAAVGADRAAILVYDGDGVMRFRRWRNLSEKYRAAVEGHSPWPRDVVAPQPVLIGNVYDDPSMTSFLPLFREEGVGSLAFIPLVTRGQLIGKFMVYYREPHEYSPHEIELATAIASHVASVTARFAAIAKLEETIRYNDLFAGVLAHDLRSPLGAIMTAAHVLLMRREGQGDGSSTKPISRILSSGQRMTRMIDQLLDVTRAKAGGGIRVERRETNLADLCEQAIAELELAFPSWTLEREMVGQLDGSWDPDRLLQIISNLVANAGQHGRPEGFVRVRVDGRAEDEVTLEVHNGGSIPASIMPSLFDPFRGTRSLRDSTRGLGLGLFIVKEITEAHGGTVEVASSPAEGTTFFVRLPRRAARY